MKYLKYFESVLNEDIKDNFYELIDLGCTYTFTNNSIELKKDNPSIKEFLPEVEMVISRLVDSKLDKILDIELVLKPNRFSLKISLKSELYLNVKIDNNTIKGQVINIIRNHTGSSLIEYEIKLLDPSEKSKNLRIKLWLNNEFSHQYLRKFKDIDEIEFIYNNRKRDVNVDLEELLNVLEQYDPNIELIPYIKKALNK